MPIKRIGKFLETDDLGIVKSLGIESAQLDECVSEIERRKIEGVFGTPCFGFKEEKLDFLKRLSGIRQVWFWDIALKSIDGIYEQTNLEYFGVSPKRPGIDFSRLQHLHDAVWHPVRNDTGIDALGNLKRLDIWRYKPKSKSFSDLRLPSSLEKIEFNWCNVESIRSLHELPRVTEMQFHYCRNLSAIDGIGTIAPNLKKLVITCCANLESFREALSLPLEFVHISIRGKTVTTATGR